MSVNKVQAGDRFRPKAVEWNEIARAVDAITSQQLFSSRSPLSRYTEDTFINKSGGNLSTQNIIWFDDTVRPLLDEAFSDESGDFSEATGHWPSDDADWDDSGQNLGALTFESGVPLSSLMVNRFYCCASAAPDSQDGPFGVVKVGGVDGEEITAVINGLAVCTVDILDGAHQYARLKADGDKTMLESAHSGYARIIQKKTGSGSDESGPTLCVVFLGAIMLPRSCVIVKIGTAREGESGIYNGEIIHPFEDDEVVIKNFDEADNYPASHYLDEDTYAVGYLRDDSDSGSDISGCPVVFITNGVPKNNPADAVDLTGWPSLSSGCSDPAYSSDGSDEWSRTSDSEPVTFVIASRPFYCKATRELYCYVRTVTADASGRLMSISAPVKELVTTAESCSA